MLVSGGADLQFTATVDDPDVSCRFDVWVPGETKPVVSTAGVTGAESTQVDGGWHVTGCAEGRYTVKVDA
jgi:hypothetical protein